MPLHGMLDLETASGDTNSAILTIGFIMFDPYSDTTEVEMNIVVPFNLNRGRGITLDTIRWWMEQSKEAQQAAWVDERTEDGSVISEFHAQMLTLLEYMDQVEAIWANDPDFDCDILRSWLDSQYKCKWKWYRKHRSLRTLKAMFDIPFIEPIGTAHNALDDCKYQAQIVRAVYQGKAAPTFRQEMPT